MQAADRVKRALVWILIVAAPARALWFIHRYAVDVPFGDDWAYVQLAWEIPGASVLWRPHNEHRVPFPKLLMAVMHRVSGLDERAGMYLCWACLLGICAILFFHFRRSGSALLAFVPIPFIAFTERQYENLLWGEGFIIALGALLAVATFALLDWERPRIAGALVCAALASVTFASCLLVWPVAAAQIVGRSRNLRSPVLWIWTACGVLVCLVYLHGWQRPPWHPPPSRSVVTLVSYFLAFAGAAVSPDATTAVAAAVTWIGASAFAVASTRIVSLDGRRLLPLAIIVFALLNSALLTAGRSGFGVGQALSSRYATLALLGLAGAWLLVIDLFRTSSTVAVSAGALLAIVVIGTVVGIHDGKIHGAATEAARKGQASVLAAWRSEPDSALVSLFPDAAYVRALTPEMERRRLSVFRTQPRQTQP